MTTDVAAAANRFAAHELAIRRLYASDAEFRALCEDYATARCALERWKEDEAKAADYRQLIKELEEEILAFLSSHGEDVKG